MLSRLLLVAFVCASVAVAAPAATPSGSAAKYLETAIRLYREFEFERALQQLERARATPSEGPAMDVAIGLYEGIIQLELGRDDQAAAAFKTALSLEPTAVLPTSVSPKVTALFEKVKASVAADVPAVAKTPSQPAPVESKLSAEKPTQRQSTVVRPVERPISPVLFVPAGVGLALGITSGILLAIAGGHSAALRGVGTEPADLATATLYRDEGKRFQTLGFIGLGGAAVGVAVTIVLFMLRPASTTTVWLTGERLNMGVMW